MSVRQNLLLFICSSSILAVLLLHSLEEGATAVVPRQEDDSQTAVAPKGTPGSDATATAAATAPMQSPAEAAAHLRDLHQAGSYDEIAQWIVNDERERMLTLLQAVDEVLTANRALQLASQKQYHTPASDGWNLGAMKDNLGPFSSQIRIINQRFVGDVAYVTLQEGDNIPLMQARFEWADGRWQYRPTHTPDSIVPELQRLARILQDIAGSVEQGAPFDTYMDAFHYRVLPQMARVVSAKDGPGEIASVSVGERTGASGADVGDIDAAE